MVTAARHPAPFTDAIVVELTRLIRIHVPRGLGIHDPFAGEGRRLARLCDQLGYVFTGTDLEPWRDADPRVHVGDATDPASYPPWPHAIVTSPTYNNGVNDHFEPRDTSVRMTYRVAVGRPLHPNNTGRYSGRGSVAAEAEYWRITEAAVAQWPDLALVNVKDSYRARRIYPLTRLWAALLRRHGYQVRRRGVGTPGWRRGENHEARADGETILIAMRP